MRQWKGFICGIAFAVGLMAIPAVADTVEKTITVLTDYVTVQIDGETKPVRNFVNEGTTYIALRDVSELFGFEVGWDDATRVASINTGKDTLAGKTAIEINGEKISAKAFSDMYNRFKSYMKGAPAEELLNATKTELTYQAVVNQKASELKLANASEMRETVEAELLTLDMSYGEEVVNQLLNAQGFANREEYVQSSINYLTNEALFSYLEKNDDRYKQIKADAKAYYEEHKEEYKQPSVQVKHILIPTVDTATNQPLPEAEVAAAKEKAEKLAKEATVDNFDALIKEHGQDPGQPAEGYLVDANTNFVAEFKEASLNLKAAGEITAPIQTTYGYHIIMATAIHEYVPYEAFLSTYLPNKFNEQDRKCIEEWLKESNIVYDDAVVQAITQQ